MWSGRCSGRTRRGCSEVYPPRSGGSLRAEAAPVGSIRAVLPEILRRVAPKDRLELDSHLPQRLETPHVRPPELPPNGRHARRFLHQRVVDGDRGHGLVAGLAHLRNFRRGGFELAAEEVRAPDEHAGVPGVVAGAQELLGAGEVRFFGERAHAVDIAFDRLADLEIAVAG